MKQRISDDFLRRVGRSARSRTSLRSSRYARNIRSTLQGLSCSCPSVRTGVSTALHGVRGYRVRTLSGYRVRTLGGLHAPPANVVLEPVSDRKAVEAALRLFQKGAQARRELSQGAMRSTLSGLGDAQAESAIAGATAGAKVGSVVPVVGTIIGAVIGAAAGWIAGKNKPKPPSPEQIAQCKIELDEYFKYAAQSPGAPLPLNESALARINWCLVAVGGLEPNVKHTMNHYNDLLKVAKIIVMKIYQTKVGDVVKIDLKLGYKNDIPFKFEFINKPFTDFASFTQNPWLPLVVDFCETAIWKGGAPRCRPFYSSAQYMRFMYDMICMVARRELPNISEADFREASKVAAQTGTSAKDIVSTVEQIIGRAVERGETSSLITTGVAVKDAPITEVSSVAELAHQAQAPPGTLSPDIPPHTAENVTALIAQMVAQGQQQAAITQAALDALNKQGVPITPGVQSAVQQEIGAQSGISPLAIGGAALAAGLLLFAFPMKRKRRK